MELGIVALLRAAWTAGIIPIIIAEIPFRQLNSFKQVLLQFAKRGKMMQSSTNKFSVPQRFFSHFYVVAVVWTTILVIATWFYAYNRVSDIHSEQIYIIWRSWFLLLLMEIQVLRRLFETIFVFTYGPSARMHVFGYLTGLFFYTAAPLSLCSTFAPDVFKFVGNWTIGFIVEEKDRIYLVSEFDIWSLLNPIMRLRWYTWFGTAIFFWGWIHQRRCHAILGSLRDNRKQVDEYLIPHGDWFNHVSSPHYLAEIVIYGGLLVASGGGDLTIWLLFIFVVANLVFAAAETQLWYRRKFDNYPTNRYCIIPFVY